MTPLFHAVLYSGHMATNTIYHVNIIDQDDDVLADIDARSTADALQYFVDSRAALIDPCPDAVIQARKTWAEQIRHRIYESTWPGDPIVERPSEDFTYDEQGLVLRAVVHGPEDALPPRPAHFRSNGKAYDAQGKHVGPGEWLTVIHEANRIAQEEGLEMVFGTPDSSGDWWAGGYVEEYKDARVLHREDESVSVVSKTDLGARLIRQAAERKGWVA